MVVLAGAAGLAGCGDDGGGQQGTGQTTATAAATTTSSASATGPAVSFVEPEDGAQVIGAVKVKMAATNFTIEPAGEVKPGAGHFHIMVDTDCIAPGQVIPKDDKHLHYGMAQTEAELTLSAGEHTLCLQAGDGAHTALDLTDKVTFKVPNPGY
jgi:hypothetical protein